MFFFFKQKTAYEMRISDWSSDVCSSDLDTDPRQWDVVGGAATTDAWVAGDVHAIGERVYYNLTHRVYQAVQETGVGNITPPDRDPEYWLDAERQSVVEGKSV